jgi:ABC-type transport system substrate-binding protein
VRTFAALVGAAVLALLPACGGTSTATPSTSAATVAPTSPPSTVPAPTTPTTFQPTAPAASGPAAAATPAAVAPLFAEPYPSTGLQFRSCGQQEPLICTYRNLQTGGIYNLAVVPAASGGWYVESVAVES